MPDDESWRPKHVEITEAESVELDRLIEENLKEPKTWWYMSYESEVVSGEPYWPYWPSENPVFSDGQRLHLGGMGEMELWCSGKCLLGNIYRLVVPSADLHGDDSDFDYCDLDEEYLLRISRPA